MLLLMILEMLSQLLVELLLEMILGMLLIVVVLLVLVMLGMNDPVLLLMVGNNAVPSTSANRTALGTEEAGKDADSTALGYVPSTVSLNAGSFGAD